MRNDKTLCNLTAFDAASLKIDNNNKEDSTTMCAKVELPEVKPCEAGTDWNPVKGALNCQNRDNTTLSTVATPGFNGFNGNLECDHFTPNATRE